MSPPGVGARGQRAGREDISAQDLPLDGRRARRARGRLAVTEAMIDLVHEGHHPPSAELVAERAGVSQASLFRYFDTLDELRQATILRYFDRFAHLFEVPDLGVGRLDERIERLVAARLALYEATEPMARLARDRAAAVPEFGATLHERRIVLAEQVRRHFAEELAPHSPARRDDLVALVSMLTSFESWTQFRDDYQRSDGRTRLAWVETLRILLGPV